ncbi:MAG: glycosyltransferase [Bacteroidales bacterium]
MPKVLRIINRFNLGGPTYNVAYLTKYLSPHYKTILAGGQKQKSEADSFFILNSLDIEPVIIPEMQRSLNPLNDLRAFRTIVKLIKHHKPDIVHTHAAKSGFLGRLAAWYCKVPITVHTFHGHVFHSYFNPIVTSVIKLIERIFARKTTAIIAISNKQKEELVSIHKIASPEKVHVIQLGFDLERYATDIDTKRKLFREKYKIQDNEILIVLVGRLVPIKNHNMFIKSISDIKAKTTKAIRAMIVGDGELRPQLQNQAVQSGLTVSTPENITDNATVIFTSWITNVDQVYAGADIVTLTSFNEGTPVSLIEAQAAGKPIVSTKVGGIADIVIENKTSFLV